MANEELNKKIARAVKWSAVAEIASKLIMPLVNMALARILAPEAFGVVATIMMVITFAEIFADAGFQRYLIQHDFKDKNELDQNTSVAFWTNMSVSLLVCLGILIWRHDLARAVGSPNLGNSLSAASLLIIVEAFSSIQVARYRRAFDFKTLFVTRLIGALIPLVATVPLALMLRNYWALLIGTFVGKLFVVAFLTWKSEWKPTIYYSFRQLKEMFAFSMWSLFETVAIWLVGHVDIFLLGTYLNEYYLGLYRTSIATVNAYMALVVGAVMSVLLSALSRCQNDDKEFKNTFYLFQRMTAALVVPMGLGMWLFSDWATRVLLGDQWLDAALFMGLWGATGAFNIVFTYFAGITCQAKGNPKISLFLHALHLMFIVPIMLLTLTADFETEKMKFDVLCVGRALIRLQLLVSAVLAIRYLYGFKVRDICKNIAPSTFSALVMCAVGWGCLALSDRMLWPMLWQTCAVGICVVVYFATLFTCFPKTRREIFETRYGKKAVSVLNAALARFRPRSAA